MSLVPVGPNTPQSVGKQVLQQLLNQESGTQEASGLNGLLGDLMTLSPAAQQLQQVPAAVTAAMSDILSGQKDVQGDLAKLKTYFEQNPNQLTSLISSLQGAQGTYGPSGSNGANQAWLAALANGQTTGAGSANALSVLMGTGQQDSIFTFLGDSGSGADSGSVSLFG
jgi:hypothetical protein